MNLFYPHLLSYHALTTGCGAQTLGEEYCDIHQVIRYTILGLGLRVKSLGFRVQGLGFRVKGFGADSGRGISRQTSGLGLGFRVQDSGLRISGADSWRSTVTSGHQVVG